MKKNFTLLFMAFSLFASAQVLTLSQDTVYLKYGEYVDYGTYKITNNSNSDIELDATIRPTCKNSADNSSAIAVCFGILCFSPVQEETTYGAASGNSVLTLVANSTDDSFKFQPFTGTTYGSYWEVTFFDKKNPDVAATAVFYIENCDSSSSTEDVTSQFNLSAFPNPTNDVVNLNFSPLSHDSELTVFNTLGKVVDKCIMQKGSTNHELDMSDLHTGSYFLKIVSGTKTSRISRVIKL